MFTNLPLVLKIIGIILGSVFTVLLTLILWKFFTKFNVSKKLKTKIKDKSKSFKFGPISYWRIKTKHHLNVKEMGFLKIVLSNSNAPSASIILMNPDIIFFYFREFHKYIDSKTDNEEKTEIENKLLELCDKFTNNQSKLISTKLITQGIELKIHPECGGNFKAKVVEVNSRNIIFILPNKLEKHLSTIEDMILRITFSQPNDGEYEFSTFIEKTQKSGNFTFIYLAHSAKIVKNQRRNHQRKKCQLPSTFYLLSIFKFEGKEKVMLHRKTMTSGYIKDISAKGMSIYASHLEEFATGRLVKIEYKLNGINETVVGKIKSKRSTNKGMRSIIHIEFVRFADRTKKNNEFFVYNIHHKYDENKLIYSDTKKNYSSIPKIKSPEKAPLLSKLINS